MVKYILLILVFFSVNSINASNKKINIQSDSLKLKGKVIDSNRNEPLVFAKVVITDAIEKKIIKQVTTDTLGRFEIAIKNGAYNVRITYIGIVDKEFNLLIQSNDSQVINKSFYVKIQTVMLNEVSVFARRKIIETTAEKIVYHINLDPTAKNKSLSEALKKVPLVSVDFKGTPSLKGNEKVQIQVNGRSVADYAISVEQALKMIPTSNIASIEVNTNPGASNDGESLAGIINIVTKNKLILGSNLIIGLESTIGKTYSAKPNINFTYGVGKINFSLNGSYTNYKTLGTTNQLYIIKSFIQTQNGDLNYQGSPVYVNSGIFYEINKAQSLNGGLTVSSSPYTFTQNFVTQIKNNGMKDEFISLSKNSIQYKSISANLEYKIKLNKPGKELIAAGLYSEGKENNFSIYKSGSIEAGESKEFSNNDNSVRTIISQFDYKLPFRKGKLQLGTKVANRQFNSGYNSSFILTQNHQGYLSNNKYLFTQGIYALYSKFQLLLPEKWVMIGGIRYERTQNRATFSSSNQTINQNFNSFLPTYVIGKNLNGGAISLTYDYKISRPGISLLNPFENYINSNTISKGNPNLLPERKNGISLAYSRNIGNSYLYIDASANFWTQYILRIYQSFNNITKISYENIGSYRELGTSANLNLQITKNIGLIIGGTFNLISTKDAAFNATFNKKINFNGNLIGNYNFKKGYIIQAEYYLYSNNYFFQSRTELPNTSSINLSKSLMNDKININIGIINPLNWSLKYTMLNKNNDLTNQSIQTVFARGITFGFSYQLGNARINKKGEINIKDNETKEGSSNPIGL